jgi:hypothetical protein
MKIELSAANKENPILRILTLILLNQLLVDYKFSISVIPSRVLSNFNKDSINRDKEVNAKSGGTRFYVGFSSSRISSRN